MPNIQSIDSHFDEAQKKWGHTDAWKQSQERTQNWTKEDYDSVAKQYEEIHKAVAELMQARETPDSPAVQAEIQKHHALVNCFFDCAPHMYKSLGEMYVSDPKFRANFEKVDPTLAEFFVEAMRHYCEQ